MHSSKKNGKSLDDFTTTALDDCSSPLCYFNRQRRWRSASEVGDDVLNISPRLNHYNPGIRPERRLHGYNSLCYSESASEYNINSSISSNETQVSKTAAELVEELATVELEVLQLERYLLSRYRKVFQQCLPSQGIQHQGLPFGSDSGSVEQESGIQITHQVTRAADFKHRDYKLDRPQSLREIQERRLGYNHTGNSPSLNTANFVNSSHSCPRESPKSDLPKIVSSHHSLAAHLSSSINDRVAHNYSKLSEDIIRCISSIYCRLSNPPTQRADTSMSSTSSVSSSSTFSPQYHGDNWSPRCHYEGASSPFQFGSMKIKLGPYSSMIEVPKLCVDCDRIDYASKMLSNYRSLIKCLHMVDPTKMEHEEQLAFWLNIHNALVMHAYLAYGLHRNHMKSTPSVLKAAYDVGGHSINAHVIQSAILRCQLHRPLLLTLRGLFSPAIKLMTGNFKHPYALAYPEPLVHFALCLGAYSDPAVRVYTGGGNGKGISQQLQLAKMEFIQANVPVPKKTRILLPKILHYYAKDASLDLPDLIQTVSECMPESIQDTIRGSNLKKCVEWSEYNSTFRYLLHRDLARQ